jgi:hypothetical protein
VVVVAVAQAQSVLLLSQVRRVLRATLVPAAMPVNWRSCYRLPKVWAHPVQMVGQVALSQKKWWRREQVEPSFAE